MGFVQDQGLLLELLQSMGSGRGWESSGEWDNCHFKPFLVLGFALSQLGFHLEQMFM